MDVTTDSEANQRVAARMAMLTWAAIGAGGVAVAALLVAAFALSNARRHDAPGAPPAPAAPAAIDATEVTLRDADGNVRGRWTMQSFNLIDKSGRVRASMSASDYGAPNLTLFSKTGGVRAVIGLGSEDSPAVTLHDDRNRVRTRIVVGADDTPSVVVIDDKGDVVGRVPAPRLTPASKAARRRD
jgi:hypothetical protein